MKDLIKELEWRGMIHQYTTPLLDIEVKNIIAYVGFDPTADSLHIGSLAPIMLMTHLRKAGGNVMALVGGATGMIGDPSGKKNERQFLTEKDLDHNYECVKNQLNSLIPYKNDDVTVPDLVNNYTWYEDMNILDFLRNVGKYITVNTMMARDSVKNRINGEGDGISFTEFTYQLIQAQDFRFLHSNYNCNLQMGGSDQWGNMVAGMELVRKAENGNVDVLTCPLIAKSDGTKFGKSEKGNIWLDANKTTPFEFYQYWMNQSDIDAEKFIKIFTFLSQDEITTLIDSHNENPSNRLLQTKLAKEVTTFVHGEEGYKEALFTTDVLFAKNKNIMKDLMELNKETFERIFATVPTTTITVDALNSAVGYFDLLSENTKCEIFESKGAVRRMVKNGGLTVNMKKVNLDSNIVTELKLIHEQYIIVQKGKKNFHLIKIYLG